MKVEMDIPGLKALLEERLRKGNPFVTYCKPSSDSLVTWICDFAEFRKKSDLSGSGFIFVPFDPGVKPVLFPSRASQVLLTPMDSFDWKPSSVVAGSNERSSDKSGRDAHMDLVMKAVEEIRCGSAKKIVVSRKEEIPYTGPDPVSVFLRLASLYPKAYNYIWFHPQVGLWTGASPETLVEIEDRAFVTMSLAGTRRMDENKNAAWGDKELHEQQMVTDLIRKELGSMLEHVGEPFTEQAGHLLHLRTDIRGKLQGESQISDLIGRLHPTAAICGLPREKALEFIRSNEGYSREYYTGFLGEVNYPAEESAHLFVNLRCMQLFPNENKVRIYVGGGITASSEAEKEWEETCAKSETMKRVFS